MSEVYICRGGGSYTLPQATDNALGGVKAKAKTNETGEVAIDTSTGKLYAPASEEYTLPQASGNALGGIKAAAKTANETAEVKIDTATGKLYAPAGGGSVVYTALIPTTATSWTAHSNGYYTNIAVSGILATDTPIVDVVTSDDADEAADELTAWALVFKITTAANTVRVYASAIPQTAVSIQIMAVR